MLVYQRVSQVMNVKLAEFLFQWKKGVDFHNYVRLPTCFSGPESPVPQCLLGEIWEFPRASPLPSSQPPC